MIEVFLFIDNEGFTYFYIEYKNKVNNRHSSRRTSSIF